MPDEFDNGTVRFTVKELLSKIDAKLDIVTEKVDAKATTADLHAVEVRVDALERTSANAAAVRTFKHALIGLSLTVAGLIVGVAALFVTH